MAAMKPIDRSQEEVRRVAEGLKRKIQESELPYREVEERAGIGRDYLRQVLRGAVKLRLEHVFAILDALGVPPADFFAEIYGPEAGERPPLTPPSPLSPAELVALLQRSFEDLQGVFGAFRVQAITIGKDGLTIQAVRLDDAAEVEVPGEPLP